MVARPLTCPRVHVRRGGRSLHPGGHLGGGGPAQPAHNSAGPDSVGSPRARSGSSSPALLPTSAATRLTAPGRWARSATPIELGRTEPLRERADAARNRLRILDAAARLFAELGVDAVSLDAVAAEAGVGKGTVFRRFGDKSGWPPRCSTSGSEPCRKRC
jgi:Bacterial regulatory proteins, tetR family